MTMDQKVLTLLAAGILLTIIAFLFNFYAGGIVFILFVAVAMSYYIMQDSKNLPDIIVDLKDNAKGIVIRNSGNSDAVNIHVALVPVNIEYDIQCLAPDQIQEFPLESMLAQAKAVATFKNVMGDSFSRSYELSSQGSYDPLKPMFPLFRHR